MFTFLFGKRQNSGATIFVLCVLYVLQSRKSSNSCPSSFNWLGICYVWAQWRGTFFFYTAVLSHWDFCHGKFGLLSSGKSCCDRVALLNLRCMLVSFCCCFLFVCFFLHNPPISDMNYSIFNVRTDVNACDCTRGHRKRVCTES